MIEEKGWEVDRGRRHRAHRRPPAFVRSGGIATTTWAGMKLKAFFRPPSSSTSARDMAMLAQACPSCHHRSRIVVNRASTSPALDRRSNRGPSPTLERTDAQGDGDETEAVLVGRSEREQQARRSPEPLPVRPDRATRNAGADQAKRSKPVVLRCDQRRAGPEQPPRPERL